MNLRIRTTAVLTGLLLSAFAAAPAFAAYADPPGRVARVSYLDGDVSFSPAGEDDWVRAVINRPLIRGDRVWADRRSRVELQLGAAAVRIDQLSSMEVLDLDDDYAQFFLAEGSLNLYVRRIWEGQVYEIATPTVAIVIRQPGSYRIDVDRNGRHTDVAVWNGTADAYGDRANIRLYEGEQVRFFDTELRDYRLLGAPRADNFDRFAFDRDRLMDSSPSLRYVSDDLIGYTELDRYGSWSTHREYGSVWYPTRVSSGWAPYRHGHWSWIEPFGWTWVDDMPWGFAVSHYGRWVYVGNRWGWIPSPRSYRAVYAPALVAFVGGSGWSVSFSSGVRPVGWFPLGPRDIWCPSYRVSSAYFRRVNVHNTVINNTTIVNVYNNVYVRGNNNVTNVNYTFRGVNNAHTVVSQDVFTRGRPVQQGLLAGAGRTTARAEIQRLAPVAPTAQSLKGAAPAARSTPARGAFQRQAVTSRAPTATPAPFRSREEALKQQPGEPLAVPSQPVRGTAASTQRPLRVVGSDATQTVERAQPRSGATTGRSAPATSPRPSTTERGRAPAAVSPRSTTVDPATQSAPRTRAIESRPAPPRRVAEPAVAPPVRSAPRSVESAPAPRQSAPPQRQRSFESAPAPQQRSSESTPAPRERRIETAPATRSALPTPRQAPQASQPAPRVPTVQQQRARQSEIQRQSVERARQSQQAPRAATQAPPSRAPQPARQEAPPAQTEKREAPPRSRSRSRDDQRQ